ncbi:MAG TPA: PorP/SprF family type IX secretion system membrane protein [Ferruginibacter sp.]|nr:PorP/SprF family type IX secretion system membrane protein [Ferruginibacter sp.]
MKKLIIFTLFISISVLVKAQDPHFSQFFASPLTLNPAFTGKFDGSLRLVANYRNQWPSIPNAYITEAGSVDFSILRSKMGNNVLGVGFSGLSDQSGNGALKLNYGSMSLSFHKSLDASGYNTIGAGFQGTYTSILIDKSKLTFEDQLSTTGFTLPTGETFTSGTNKSYWDVAAGILFSGSSDGVNNYYAGVSMYHLNQPNTGFYAANTSSPLSGFTPNGWKLQPRTTANVGGSTPISQTLTLSAAGMYQIQNNSTETVIGAALSANVNQSDDVDDDGSNDVNVYVGSWVRLGDAVIPYAALEFSGLRIGASYDVNISKLNKATLGQGGVELSLIYIYKSPADSKIPCPKF